MSLKRQLDGLGRPQPHDIETKAPTAQVEPHRAQLCITELSLLTVYGPDQLVNPLSASFAVVLQTASLWSPGLMGASETSSWEEASIPLPLTWASPTPPDSANTSLSSWFHSLLIREAPTAPSG